MFRLLEQQEVPNPPVNLNFSVCDTSIKIGDITIYDSVIIPFCLLAVAIGFAGGYQILKTKAIGRLTYSLSFFMFGTMMFTAMILHCFLHDDMTLKLSFILAVIDLSLSSDIALSFAFNGLVDLGILGETRRSFAIMFTCYFIVSGLWIYALLGSAILWWFGVLYVSFIGICCGTFIVSKIFYFLIADEFNGAKWLLLSGLAGGIGFLAIYFPQISFWLCVHVTPYLNYDFWWYSASDISMYCLCMYFFASRIGVTYSLIERQQ